MAIAVTVLICGYAKPATPDGLARFSVWLGLLGYALQGLMEFGLYIPALAWTAFRLAGWLAWCRTLAGAAGRPPAFACVEPQAAPKRCRASAHHRTAALARFSED